MFLLTLVSLFVLASTKETVALKNSRHSGNNRKESCMPMSLLKENMPRWVGTVPYSHLVNKTWGYPTDCSGFLSWSLQVSTNIKAYQYASGKYSTAIVIDELRYGDIVTHVFDKSGKLCPKKPEVEQQTLGENTTVMNNSEHTEGRHRQMFPTIPEVSGHVFFFDRWDADRNYFWAYESSDRQDQTEECLQQRGVLTRSLCFNHHVKKKRGIIEKWSKDYCISKEYGVLKGGARRLSATLLCNAKATQSK